ncbi:MAG: TRAP transporter substrate-binding protein DctP, partial [Candidatus Binatia bacterium]
VLTAFVLMALTPQAEAGSVIKVSSCLVKNHDQVETYFEAFHKPFNQLAKGEAKLNYIGGPEVTPRKKQATALKRGLIDMIFCPAGYYSGIVNAARLLGLSNQSTIQLRANGGYELLQQSWAKNLNSKILAWCCYGVDFHIYTTYKPKESKTTGLDLTGVKMRSTGLYNQFFKAMHAIPVNISATELYTALQRGVVKGFAWPEGALAKMGVQKYIKYRVYPGFYRSTSMATINLDKWKSLPKPVQEKLVKVGMDFEKKSQTILRKKADIDNEKLFKAGMKKLELKGAVRKAYVDTVYGAKWKDNEKRKYIVPFETLKAKMFVPGGA